MRRRATRHRPSPRGWQPGHDGRSRLAHAEISASAAAALRDFLGTDRLDFSLTNPNVAGVVRSFQSFSQAADEAAASRIYAGQHFRYDEDAGQALGADVGEFISDDILGPVANGGQGGH